MTSGIGSKYKMTDKSKNKINKYIVFVCLLQNLHNKIFSKENDQRSIAQLGTEQ